MEISAAIQARRDGLAAKAAIKIGADTHMRRAPYQLANVVNGFYHALERQTLCADIPTWCEHAIIGHDADYTITGGDPPHQIIREKAWSIDKGSGISMGCSDGAGVVVQCAVRGIFPEMAEVEEQVILGHGLQQSAASIGKGAGVTVTRLRSASRLPR